MTSHLPDTFDGWPPEGVLFPVQSVSLRVLDGEHPFHSAQKAAAMENWRHEVARQPAVFDGRMVFQHRVSLVDGAIASEAYVVPYSTFLWWRRQPVRAGGVHLFAFPVLVSGDGALIAIRMSKTTVNAGQVYFAAGSLDPSDIVDGYCDIEANMRREVREETGLDLDDGTVVADPQLYGAHANRSVTLYRLFRFAMTADELIAAINRHEDQEGEVEEAVAIRSADPALHRYNPAMLPLLDWFFSEKR
ncbi:NUDIX hydrolase [Rhizobiaceae bacterium BDR2-2]|uniref:NUDIX hydrolase n=1 Tax=Ectorhizobium quercum TaxID=2965071 RepID=A0AAE3SYP5_9HYPH|nr:NUDIX hydrolase [Ectorhizobium quercum]MCX8999760.1 NUDIX hydrolase [Ectorhizobium quercum]